MGADATPQARGRAVWAAEVRRDRDDERRRAGGDPPHPRRPCDHGRYIARDGEPRASGTNNWDITKRHIDGDPELFDIFEGIRDTSLSLRRALVKGDWDATGEILRLGYPQRKRLSPHITTPHMDHLIDVAHANGAIATKVCGAGGGGCIAFFCHEGRKPDVEAALRNETDAEVLDWKLQTKGLDVNSDTNE